MKLTQFFERGIIGNVLAIAAGVLLTLAFAPFNYSWLAIFSTTLLLGLWVNVTPRIAFLRGWLFGVGLFGSGVYWVYISIHFFGNANIFVSALITCSFIAVLGLFPGLSGYCLNRYFPKTSGTKFICAFPAVFFLFDWLRGLVMSGFPWLMLGYSQIYSPLRGFAPIFSVYGVTLAVLLTAGLLINAITYFRSKSFMYVLSNLIAIACIWSLGYYLSSITWTYSKGHPITVSLVQGAIPQEVKWSADAIQPSLDRYENLSLSHWNSDLVIWPEGAIPLTLNDASEFIGRMSDNATSHHSTFITGIPIQKPQTNNYFNAVIATGNGHGVYLKHRLVPFGEYMPFAPYSRKILDYFITIPMSDFLPAYNTPEPLVANKLKIASFICYEIAFPEQGLVADSDVSMILTVSDDAWFGHSIAQAQHLQMGQMRALENGRPVLLVTNDGLTATVSSNGRVQTVAPAYVPFVLVDMIQPMIGKTPWQRFRTDPIFGLVLLMLLIALNNRRQSA